MHPGNIFVDIDDPADPRWIAIDCAIMGELTAHDRWYLARQLLAFLDRDYEGVARLALEAGWVPGDADLPAIAAVVREVCEPVYGKALQDIEFGPFLAHLFNAAQAFELEVQPQLVLLQKTLLNIEGLGRQLYPQLDVWRLARPFMQRWMSAQVGPEAVLERWSDDLPQLLRELPALPANLRDGPHELKRLHHLTRAQGRAIDALQRARRRDRQILTLLGLGFVLLLLFG